MAELVVQTDKIIRNIKKISDYLEPRQIEWSLVTKVLSGDPEILKKLLSSPEIKRVHSIADSRLSSLKTIKKMHPELVTMYIKPPAIQLIKTVISYADISLNSSFSTIEALNKEAKRQGKVHRIVIMIEMGELREGVVRDELLDFYKQCFELSNINVIGIGTNLGCMYGIEPTFDKLIQLSLYKQLIETMFSEKLELISGGSSITLPMLKRNFPKTVNHFRIGEAAFLGVSPLDGKKVRNLSTKAFSYQANIIEMEEKYNEPDGVISEASIGHTAQEVEDSDYSKSYKAILDFGVLDLNVDDISPVDPEISFFGTTSDMTVYDVGKNLNRKQRAKYKVGQKIYFDLNYMGVARIMNSKFIQKIIK